MKSHIVSRLLPLLGRAYHVSSPSPSLLSSAADALQEQATSLDTQRFGDSTLWELSNVRLRAGWYMLEVEHSIESIGCVLSVRVDDARQEHLQLTSKPVCKRIVKLNAPLDSCIVTIDQTGCTLGRFSLVALSSSFALQRMRKRMMHRGHGGDVIDAKAQTLYARYQTLVHDAMIYKPYLPNELFRTAAYGSSVEPAYIERSVCLILHTTGESAELATNDSVEAAITFARCMGWSVFLQDSHTQNSHRSFLLNESYSESGRVFHMLLDLDAQYREDVFHLLLDVVSEDTVLVYADHDHIDSHGVRTCPVLKPAWNPELLLNTNYIQLPWMVSDTWVRQLEAVEGEVLESPERVLLAAALGVHALSETSLPALTDLEVVRLPIVLASLRLHQSSSVNGFAAAAAAAADVESISPWPAHLQAALRTAGKRATVVAGIRTELSRVYWSLPSQSPTVDIIIPTRDKVSVLKACIDSIAERTTSYQYRIVIVDNDSVEAETEQYYRSIAEVPHYCLIRYKGAFNYSAINNYAASQSSADVLVLLNNDTEVISDGWLEELVSQAMRPGVGCVGAKLYYSNGRIQHGGVIVGINGVAGHAHRYSPRDARGYCNRLIMSQNLTAVTGACLAVRRTTYQAVGGLDEEQLQVAWNDVDFCLKVRTHGYRNVWTPFAELFHHEGLSRGADDTHNKVARVDRERDVMTRRWDLQNFTDPAYHPLLTRENESFGLG